jgi:hypothetical protein
VGSGEVLHRGDIRQTDAHEVDTVGAVPGLVEYPILA